MIWFLYSISSFVLRIILTLLSFSSFFNKKWNLKQRLYPKAKKSDLWIHCASVGEFLGAFQLANHLREKQASLHILISVLTPDAYFTAKEKQSEHIQIVPLPFDFPTCVQSFLNQCKPKVHVIYETDLWPFALKECHKQKIPVYTVAARMSSKAQKRLQFSGSFGKNLLQNAGTIFAQTQLDSQKFLKFNANVQVKNECGEWKIPTQLKENLPNYRSRFWNLTLLSVHLEEWNQIQEFLVPLQKEILHNHFNLLVIPRFPQESEEWNKRLSTMFAKIHPWKDFQEGVSLINCYGQVPKVLPQSQQVLIGGTFHHPHMHSPWEALENACSLLCGPYYLGREEWIEVFKEHQLIQIIQDSSENALDLRNSKAPKTDLIQKVFSHFAKHRNQVEEVLWKALNS